jgi:hypothetical protein
VKADQKTRNRFLGGDAPFGYRVEPDYDAAGKRKGGRLEAMVLMSRWLGLLLLLGSAGVFMAIWIPNSHSASML